ncbi:citrate synthase [Williamsia sterculiae]|uniref:citrate synthase (unknown stereospecificity) n=1 Tax=Williamsia sterculiae TaxID=1344003 RepID=A0A1N7DSE7_9NOCA|nr:citrate synthase [Williamsia sterculiae]SIR78698.1 citrate synthase [Williamsia sterculiae]
MRRHTRRWPDAVHHDGRDYLTTAQTARVLGVRPATLYAYVSRGQLTSTRIAGVRGSVYALAEVDAFARRTVSRPPAGVVERIRTELTLLADDELYYRGERAVDLAWSRDFRQVAGLLWDRPWPTVDPTPVRVPAQWRGIDIIRTVGDHLGARDPHRHDITPDAVVGVAARVIETTVGSLPLIGVDSTRSDASVARRLWPRLSPMAPTPSRVALLNAALVLLADHDLSAGAVAARVAASSRGSAYAVISAGLGAFDGPLHGGATSLAQEFLSEVLRAPDPAAVIGRRDRLPGCGHIVYTARDPRAESLLSALATEGGRDDIPAAIDAIRAGAVDRGRGLVNSDLALAAVATRFRMVPDASTTIFALARIVGWVAHALEEYSQAPLRFRPEGVYVGKRPSGT